MYRIQVSDSLAAWNKRLRDALRGEILWYLGLWIPFGGIVQARRIPDYAPDVGQITRQVILALWLYDILFFIGHNVLHRSKFLYKHVHSKHHKMPVVRAGNGK